MLIGSDTSENTDRRVLLQGISWPAYEALRDSLFEHGRRLRLTFFENAVEIMSPGFNHEVEKTLFARLLETWAGERDVDLRGLGELLLKDELARLGLEPDECYTLGPIGEPKIPDIAIEVVATNPLLDKLLVYAGLGVPEVWTWICKTRQIAVRRLVDGAYVEVDRSVVLPGLDLELLTSFIQQNESHTRLSKSYRAALRG